MQVKEIMTKEVVTVKRSTTLRELLKKFTKFHIFPLVPVVEDDGTLVGIVSFRNLTDVLFPYRPEILKNIPFLDEEKTEIFKSELTEEMGDLLIMEDIMEKKFIFIKENTSLEEAYNLMKLHLKEEYPVINEENKMVGIIGIFDILKEIFRTKGIL